MVLQGSAPCTQHPEELNHPRVWGRGGPGDAVTANLRCPEFGMDSDFDMGTWRFAENDGLFNNFIQELLPRTEHGVVTLIPWAWCTPVTTP